MGRLFVFLYFVYLVYFVVSLFLPARTSSRWVTCLDVTCGEENRFWLGEAGSHHLSDEFAGIHALRESDERLVWDVCFVTKFPSSVGCDQEGKKSSGGREGPRNTRMTRKKEKTKKERRKVDLATEGKAGGWGSLWDACLCFFISCI